MPIFNALAVCLFRHHTEKLNAVADQKHQYLEQLLQKDVLTWPTLALVKDWLEIDEGDLKALTEHGEACDCSDITLAPVVLEMNCHVSAAINHLFNPTLQIYSGFSSGMNFHSWLVDPQTHRIIEPTPIIRETYYGYRIKDPQVFIQEESPGIRRAVKRGEVTQSILRHITP